MTNEIESTFCYTYKVEMLIQVVAKDEPSASDFLEKSGGYEKKLQDMSYGEAMADFPYIPQCFNNS
jgi:hypothetical protein